MDKKHRSLGDLDELIENYLTALSDAETVEAVDKEGKHHKVEKGEVDKVVADIRKAKNGLSKICQQAVLAVALTKKA